MRSLAMGLFVLATTALFADTSHCPVTYSYSDQSAWDGSCNTGSSQSPIDLTTFTQKSIPLLNFNYSGVSLSDYNDSTKIKVDIPASANQSLQLGNSAKYPLIQFHFHFPAEHTINGVAYDGELHLVHQDPNTGNLYVLAIFIVKGTTYNVALDSVVSMGRNLAACKSRGPQQVDISALLPDSTWSYSTYSGSLTTPPCDEVVTWLILGNTIAASPAQIAALKVLSTNARATQPLNGRTVYVTQFNPSPEPRSRKSTQRKRGR